MLRVVAFQEPLHFLSILASPECNEFLTGIWHTVCEQSEPQTPRPDFGPEDFHIHCLRVNSYPCAVIEMPAPVAMPEAYFAAFVVMMGPESDDEEETPEARYFTLERSFSMDGGSRTVLGSWTKDGTHLNFGDGPEPELDAFVDALKRLI
jgi:hypothetical protein